MFRLKVVVCGRTGLQGRSVIAYLLNKELCEVIALARYPGSAAATALATAGVKVVKVDTNNPATLLGHSGAAMVYSVLHCPGALKRANIISTGT